MATKLVPWGNRLTQLLDDALSGAMPDPMDWHAPAANVIESDNDYEITLDVPGLSQDAFHVEYEEGQLRVSGERKFEREEKGKTYHRVERHYGKFRRHFSLPRDVQADKIAANYEAGVLRITVPKSPASVARKIEVR